MRSARLCLYVFLSIFLFFGLQARAQQPKNYSVDSSTGGVQKIELTNPEDIKDLQAYINAEKDLATNRKKCKSEKNEKQERQCLCENGKEYEQFHDLMIQTQLKHGTWDPAVLTYQEEGKTKRRRFLSYNSLLEEFNFKCWKNADESYTAIYDWDYPNLKITEPQEIKDLSQVNNYYIKGSKVHQACLKSDYETKSLNKWTTCNCKNIDKFSYVVRRIDALLKKYPQWEKKALNYEIGSSVQNIYLGNMRRMMQRNMDRCQK